MGKITEARIDSERYENTVFGCIDGEWKMLFKYFPDELYFTSDEFIGLTEDQAHELFHKKDIAYLQS